MRLFDFYGDIVCEEHMFGAVNPEADEVADPGAECVYCSYGASKESSGNEDPVFTKHYLESTVIPTDVVELTPDEARQGLAADAWWHCLQCSGRDRQYIYHPEGEDE